MTTHFADPKNGSDSNPGTQLSPWKNPFNKQGSIAAGDTVRIRMATALRNTGGFTLTASGTSGNPITWTWYSEAGDPDIPPTITGLRVLNNWTQDSANVWYIGLAIPASAFSTVKASAANTEGVFENMRLWVSTSAISNDAAAQPYSGTKGGLGAGATWFMDAGADRLYIYSTTDPNNDGKLRELLYPGDSNLQINISASFVTFDGIRVEGARDNINLGSGQDTTFINDEFRRSSQNAFKINGTNIKVRSCILDQVSNISEGDYRVGRSVNVDNGQRDGIRLNASAANAVIEFNTFKDYNHTAVLAAANSTNAPDNALYQYCEITAPNQKWGRAFAVNSHSSRHINNLRCRWNFHFDFVVENKCGGGAGCEYYGNVFWDQTRIYTTANDGVPTDSSNENAPLTIGGNNNPVEGIEVKHNTVVNVVREGVKLVSYFSQPVSNNLIANNLLVDTCTDKSVQAIRVSPQGSSGQLTNNQINNNCCHMSNDATATIDYLGTDYTPTDFNNATLSQGNTAQGNLLFDPAFLDKANKDFHLNATDTALHGAGFNLADASLLDRDGNAYDPDYDIGAYVFTAGGGAEPEEKIGSGGGLELGLSAHYRFLVENQTGVTLAANAIKIYALRAKYTPSGEPDYEPSEALYSNGSSVPDGSFGQFEVITNLTNKWLGGWFIAEVTTPTGANGDVSISFQMSTNEGARWPDNKTSDRIVVFSFSGVDTQSKNFIL